MKYNYTMRDDLSGLRALLRVAQKRSFRAAAAMGMAILGSHPQHALLLFLFLIGWMAFVAIRSPETRKFTLRFGGIFTLLSLGAVPFGMLATGASLQHFGGRTTALAMFALMVAATAYALASRHIRNGPDAILQTEQRHAA